MAEKMVDLTVEYSAESTVASMVDWKVVMTVDWTVAC
jgi:hypothetical protein